MSLLGAFNAVSPKDAASRRLAEGLAYGPEPRQRLDLYGPRRPSGAPVPVVLFFYGGSWDSGDRREYAFAGRALAGLGYIAVIADYRVVPAIEYPAFLDDGTAAVAWVVRHIADFGGDATRLALMGHSAGAYNAAMLALDPAYLRARGLLERVRAVIGLSGPYDFFPFDIPISQRVFGAAPDGPATQPVNLVQPDAPPMLLAAGRHDRLVLPRNSAALATRLRDQGASVVERYYRAGHALPLLALGQPLRWRLPVLADTRHFLLERLGPPGAAPADQKPPRQQLAEFRAGAR